MLDSAAAAVGLLGEGSPIGSVVKPVTEAGEILHVHLSFAIIAVELEDVYKDDTPSTTIKNDGTCENRNQTKIAAEKTPTYLPVNE